MKQQPKQPVGKYVGPRTEQHARQEIVKRQDDSLAVVEPEYLQRKQQPRGGEEVDQSDLIIPRLSLAQKMSDEIDESHPKYIEGLEEGDFFNNVTKENYGKSVNIVPVFKFATRVRWESREKGSPILCQSFDGKQGIGDNPVKGVCMICPFSQFQSGKNGESEPPECTEFKNIGLVVLPEGRRPMVSDAAVLPFKRGSLPEGKQMISMIDGTHRDWFSWIVRLTSALKPGKKGKYMVPTATFVGQLTPYSVKPETKLPPSRTNVDTYKIGEGAYESIRKVYGRAKEEQRQPIDLTGEEVDESQGSDFPYGENAAKKR